MAEVASAYVTLLPSAKGFARGIQGEIGGDLNRAGRQGGTDFGSGMKSGVAGIATKVFAPLAIAAAGLGLGKILSDSITAGSDFQQGLGATDAIFKKDAAGIKKSAEAAALNLGLPKNAYLELATVLGAGLKNKGVKGYAKQTENLIGIGADLAAQFGGDTSTAVEAIASAMRGESDPIERYGVSLNETAVAAELASQGIKKGKGGYTEQQKTMGRLALITKQTADAQGTFAKESDTYAGSQQRLSASYENIKTQVGTALLPALTDLSQWFLTKGLPAIKEFGGWVKDELWPALKDGWETVRPGLEKAQAIIMDAFGGENGATVKDFATFITDKLIPGIAEFVNVWLPAAATQMAVTIDVIQGIYNIFKTVLDIQAQVASAIIGTFIKVMDTGASMLEALSQVPGFGWAKTAAEKMRLLSGKAGEVKDAIDNIPDKKDVKVSITVDETFKSVGSSRFNNGGVGYAPGRATGGPVKAGQPYMVGEKGPELIVPKYHGNVIPNHDLGSGKGLPSASSGIDYYRLADVMSDAMRQTPLAVGVSETTTAVNRRNAVRARG